MGLRGDGEVEGDRGRGWAGVCECGREVGVVVESCKYMPSIKPFQTPKGVNTKLEELVRRVIVAPTQKMEEERMRAKETKLTDSHHQASHPPRTA